MPQEYTVDSWKPWENNEGLIRDAHGNYKGTVTFAEDRAEPIDATFKTQPNAGDKKYGTVTNYTTKAGNTRKGFKSAQKPQSNFSGGGSSAGSHSDDRSDGMRQGMCFNNAANFVNAQNAANDVPPEAWAQMVYEFAQALYNTGELKAKGAVAAAVTDAFNVTNEDISKPINLDDIPF